MSPGEIIHTILEEFPYALYGSMLIGVLCSFLGVYVVARRVVFLGAVMTQISVLGLAVTFLPFLAIPHTIGSLVITIGAVIALSRMLTGRSVPREAVLGTVFVIAIGARILVMQLSPRVEVAEIENLLRGDILFVTPELFYLMAGVFAAAMAIHLFLYKEFTYTTFDPETASTQGFASQRWDMAFYLIAGVVISVATHIVGDLFVFGFLVIPPVIAMLIARRVRHIFLVSTLIGGIVPAIGLYFAFALDLPSSPTIVVAGAVLLGLVWVVSLVRKS